MKLIPKFGFFASMAMIGMQAWALTVGTPVTYSKLVWTVTTNTPAFAGCPQLVFDVTGDLTNGNALVIGGALNCLNDMAYAVVGSAYVARDGSLSIKLIHGGFTTYCPRVANFVGTCSTFDGLGVQRGNGSILLQ